MKSVAVIGLGNLGKRHLQSLLEYKDDFSIYGVEVNEEVVASLKKEFDSATIVSSLEELPGELDLVVIATSSAPRRYVFEQLMAHSKVKNIIFEKVLFQRLEDYGIVSDILKGQDCKAWVNCARREWKSYVRLKDTLKDERILSFSVSGGEWGLCCNGIHMVDIFQCLTDSESVSIGNPLLVPGIFESKRAGYKEMYGVLTGQVSNGALFQVTCVKDAVSPVLIMINCEDANLVIEEGRGKAHIAKKEKSWEWETFDFPIEYQSGLTGRVAKSILETGTCNLPTYEISMKTHVKYIEMWLKEFKRQGWEGDACPIT